MTDAHHATDENNNTTETTTLRRIKTMKEETRTKRRKIHTKRRRNNVLTPQHGGSGRSGAEGTSPLSLPHRPTHFHGVFSFLFSFHNSTTARYGCVKGVFFLGSHEEKKDGLLFFFFAQAL
jgi:hypothetical protein